MKIEKNFAKNISILIKEPRETLDSLKGASKN